MKAQDFGLLQVRPQAGCLAVGIGLIMLGLSAALAAPDKPSPEEKVLSVLKQIRDEVKEMGPYPGEDFVRREFFVGADDDDTNKDTHVNVLIQALQSGGRMTLQVTEMAADPGNPRARLAKASKLVICLFAGDRLEIQRSDYEEKALSRIAPEILTAIRNKKRLLKSRPPGPTCERRTLVFSEVGAQADRVGQGRVGDHQGHLDPVF